MTITEYIQSLLESSSAVTVLAPASRIRVPGDWQNLARPYIVHVPVNPDPTYTHSGLAGLRIWSYQVSCFADSFGGAEELAVAVRDALSGLHDVTDSGYVEGVQIFWRGQTPQYESDTRVHHIAVEFKVAEAL